MNLRSRAAVAMVAIASRGCGGNAPPPESVGPVDTDRDGIADMRDQCPRDPEPMNGIDDEDGCPDLPQECGEAPFAILSAITFHAGSDIARDRNLEVLNAVA